jgi:hypothetical protein
LSFCIHGGGTAAMGGVSLHYDRLHQVELMWLARKLRPWELLETPAARTFFSKLICAAPADPPPPSPGASTATLVSSCSNWMG